MYWSKHQVEIRVPAFVARFILAFSNNSRILVMCRGYNEDCDSFTELIWEDDKDLDFGDRITYPEFQIWVRIS